MRRERERKPVSIGCRVLLFCSLLYPSSSTASLLLFAPSLILILKSIDPSDSIAVLLLLDS